MSLFFISCPLNYENELVQEFKSFWFEMIDLDGLPTRSEMPEPEIIRGGIQIETLDHLGFQINFFSKIANRVLLRIAKFESRYFDQFEKSLSKVDFNKYLDQNEIKLKIESHKSRLNHEKNIIEAATNVLNKKKYRINTDSKNVIFLRLEKDMVTVSLDTSGEHLHRRGYAVFRGEAPLRETLAAYLIRKVNKYVSLNENLTLIDPFAGSGTILFEANSFNIPNLERNYSWLSFRNIPKMFKSESWKKNYRWIDKSNSPQSIAIDIDPKSIENIQSNKIEFMKIFKQKYLNQKLNLTTYLQDSRKFITCPENIKKNSWIVTNPPYGIRLADEDSKKILEQFDGYIEGLVLIHPTNWKMNFKKMKLSESEDFSNQGLNLRLSIFISK